MHRFTIYEADLQQLAKQDPILGKHTHRVKDIQRTVNPDLFGALIDSIVGQQISLKAAKTVGQRLKNLLTEINPESVANASIEAIQQCGMSLRKATNIQQIGSLFYTKQFDVDQLKSMDDDPFVQRMIQIKGVGPWTAEMLLIFSLERPNIISYHDLGIKRGIMKVYGWDTLTKETFNELKSRYSPYNTLASLILWEVSQDKQSMKKEHHE